MNPGNRASTGPGLVLTEEQMRAAILADFEQLLLREMIKAAGVPWWCQAYPTLPRPPQRPPFGFSCIFDP